MICQDRLGTHIKIPVEKERGCFVFSHRHVSAARFITVEPPVMEAVWLDVASLDRFPGVGTRCWIVPDDRAVASPANSMYGMSLA